MAQIKSTTTTKTTSAAYASRVLEVGDLVVDEFGSKVGKGDDFSDTPYIDSAPTTQELIDGSFKYDLDHVVVTSGFSTKGKGIGKWKQNGVTGQTASQSPTDLDAALFNDAEGVQYAIVSDGPVNVLALGAIDGNTTDNVAVLNEWKKTTQLFIPKGVFYDRSALDAVEIGEYILDGRTVLVDSNSKWWRKGAERMLIAAHRGFGDLAPEDTIAAVSYAYSRGADIVEFDIQWTSDNVPIIMHDTTLDRTTDGTGNVADVTLAFIQTLDAGSHFDPVFNRCKVPTFQAMLDYIKGKFERVHYELKNNHTEAQIQQLVGMVRDAGMDEGAVFISFINAHLALVRKFSQTVGVAVISATRAELDVGYKDWGGKLYCSFTEATLDSDPTIVEYARSLGYDVYSKIITKSAEASELMEVHGITVIQSDLAVNAQRRYPAGIEVPINSDYSNMLDELATGSVVISGEKIIVTSTAGGRTGKELGFYYNPNSEISIGFFGSIVSISDGVFGAFSGTTSRAYSNEINMNSEDVVYYETSFITIADSVNSASKIEQRFFFFGAGAAGVGSAEYFRLRVMNSGRALETPCTARGHFLVNGGAVNLTDIAASHGILSAVVNGSVDNEINITLDVAIDVSSDYFMLGLVDVRGTTYSDTHFAAIANTTNNVVNVRVYRYDGAAVDLTTINSLPFHLQVS